MESNIILNFKNLSEIDKNIYLNEVLPILKNEFSLESVIYIRGKYRSMTKLINDTTMYTCQKIFGVSSNNKNQVLSNTIENINLLLS